jgi:retinol dehydrogenase-12
MLYGKGAKVYIASRSIQKITKAIKSIQDQFAKSNGKLVSLKLDLADLSSIKASAEEFLAKEERLDVLVHNAGVMTPPAGSKTKLVRTNG